jgi:hypothetical protein
MPRERQSPTETEITPAMIEAGAAVPRVTIEMWNAGVAAYECWEPEKEEPEARWLRFSSP